MVTFSVQFTLVVFVTLVHGPIGIKAGCEELSYPQEFVTCGKDAGRNSQYKLPGESVLDFCTQKYLWVTPNQRWHRKIKPEEPQGYFSSIYSENFVETKTRGKNKQWKKVVKWKRKKPCIRKEIRQMSRVEWKRFIAAIKSAKKDKTVSPNVWDFFAKIHTSPEAEAAHHGPSFLSFHRVYLLTLELALQKYDRRVCLPYWDTSFEALTKDPRKSVVFSKHFLGAQRLDPRYSGGNVGPPFQNWNLTRNLMKAWQRDSLIDKADIQNILGKTDFLSPNWYSKLEFDHNGIHNWVGGHMSNLETAAFDPMFWVLHCYIDYLWELCRKKQKDKQIDPETYPTDDYNEYHAPHRELRIFGKIAHKIGFDRRENETLYLRNRDGYSNIWTEKFYSYAPGPTCENKCSKSRWLTCYMDSCTSKSVAGKFDEKVKFLPWDMKKYRQSNAKQRGNRKSSDNNGMNYDNAIDTSYAEPPAFYDEEQPIQHTFYLNGKSDVREWVYMAVRVTVFRSDGIHYQSYPVKNGQIQYGYDIFDFHGYKKHTDDIKLGDPASFEYCGTSGAGDSRVYVQTVGKNYNGHFLEYAIIDERYPISHSIAYVGVKKPERKMDTEVMFSAYDECGRLCKPMCLISGSSPPKYKHCSGVMRINKKKPLVFHETLGDAMMYYWEIPSPSTHYSPYSQYTDLCINFLCDSSTKYPWDNDESNY